VLFEGEHVSIASLPGMYERTIPLYTFSKTYAITGLRLGYIAVQNPTIRERVRKMLFYTVSNTSSLIQYGAVGALTGSQAVIEDFCTELRARRELFYAGVRAAAPEVFSGEPPAGAFYAFLRINPSWRSPLPDAPTSSLNTVGTPNGTQTLTFRRAMTRNIEIAAWHELVKLGDVAAARKSFSITAYDAAGTPVARYHVTDGFPSKLEVTTLKAGASEVLMETVTFTCEFIQRVSV
jgi:phage tail-like protein